MAKKTLGPRSKKRDMDDQFEQFLRESLSTDEESMDTARVKKHLKKKKENSVPAWFREEDEEDDDDDSTALLGTGKSFLKSKKPQTSTPADESKPIHVPVLDSLEDESLRLSRDTPPKPSQKPSGVPALSLGDSYTDTLTSERPESRAVGADNGNVRSTGNLGTLSGLGKETLEEMADKRKFFENLERSGDGTIDYSRMNKALDNSETLAGSMAPPVKVNDDKKSDASSEKKQKTQKSVDFLDPEENEKEEGRLGDRGMLDKVLLDSMESLGTTGGKHASREEDIAEASEKDSPKDILDRDDDGDDDLDGNFGSGEGGGSGELGRTDMGLTDTSYEVKKLLRQHLDEGGFGSTLLKEESTLGGADGTSASPGGTGITGTGGFGMEGLPIPPSTQGTKDRSVDDILKEAYEWKSLATGASGAGPSALDLSPVGTGQDDQYGFDLSPIDKYAPGTMDSDYRQAEDTLDSPRPVPAKRQKPSTSSSSSKPIRPPKKYGSIESSGYGRGNSSSKIKQWSPAHTAKSKVTGTESPKKVRSKTKQSPSKKTSTAGADSQLVASVQSFTDYLKEHFTTQQSYEDACHTASAMPDMKWSMDEPALSNSQRLSALEREKKLVSEVKDWQEQWREERKIHTKLKADMIAMEHDYKRKMKSMKMEFEQQLFELKQENYVLAAKVSENESDTKKKKVPTATLR